MIFRLTSSGTRQILDDVCIFQFTPDNTEIWYMSIEHSWQYQIDHKTLTHNIVFIWIFFSFKVRVMVLNATFNNISVILWWLVLLVEETGVPGENHFFFQWISSMSAVLNKMCLFFITHLLSKHNFSLNVTLLTL